MNDPQTMHDIMMSLEQLYASDAQRAAWLNAPNILLDGDTPQRRIEAGAEAEVLQVLDILLSGAFV